MQVVRSQGDLDGKRLIGCVLKQQLSLTELSTTLCGSGGRGPLERTSEATGTTKHVKDVYQAWQYTVRRFISSISSCSRSMAQIENCYYTNRRVWLERSSVSHMKHHVKFTNEQVLTMIVKVLECGEYRTVCCSQCMVFFI